MNLSVVFIIFLKEVCKVHTLFVVFFNILRYEVWSCELGQYGTVVESVYKAVPVPLYIKTLHTT